MIIKLLVFRVELYRNKIFLATYILGSNTNPFCLDWYAYMVFKAGFQKNSRVKLRGSEKCMVLLRFC